MSLKRPEVKAPRFFGDLYADLRDRRLLPVIGVLVVAIAAVPLLLARGSEPAPAAPATPAAAEVEVPTEPAVLAASEGVRDYRKRLADLKSKNPFEQKFTVPEATGAAVEDVSSVEETGTTEISGGSGSTGTATETSTLDPSSSQASSDTTTTSSDTSDSSGSSKSSDSSGTKTKVETEEVVYAYRINVKVGPEADPKVRKGVGELSLLPSEEKPVVLFLGVTEDAKSAVFVPSSDVTATSGKGSCLPSPDDCEFLTLEVGKRHHLDYTVDGATQRYVLELLAIKRDVLETRREDAEPKRKPADEEPPSSIASWLGL